MNQTENNGPSPAFQQQLASSLFELANAVEHLAQLLQNQKELDNNIHIRAFSVLLKRFSASAKQLKKDSSSPNVQAIKKQVPGYIEQWLGSKKITLFSHQDCLRADDTLNQAAAYLATHYSHLKPFYKELKISQAQRKDVQFRPGNTQSISYIKKWCRLLKDKKLIDHFSINADQSFSVEISELHNACHFIYGYWLEILLRRELAVCLNACLPQIRNYDIVSRAEVQKPDQTNTEFDLLLMLNDTVYWFECKSGTISEYFDSFHNHRILLGQKKEHSFLVIPHPDHNIIRLANHRSGMETLTGTGLREQLEQKIFNKL